MAGSDTAAARLAERIDALLPQTQCTKCGYAGCLPYAQAIASEAAPINRCPPGGAEGIARLAALLGRDTWPLDAACGAEKPLEVAVIDPQHCIGCTLCIQACPVDAIIGAPKRMHTVIPQLCTGCDLCLPPCPVDCIAMVPVQPPREWSGADAVAARARLNARNARLVRDREERDERLAAKAIDKLRALGDSDDPDTFRRKSVIEAAIARARARRAQAAVTGARRES